MDLSETLAFEALKEPVSNTVFLAYVSAYGNTRIMAEKIAEGVRLAGNIEVDLCDIEKMDQATLEKKLIHSAAVIVGSPTFNQNILLPVYQLFALINPIRDKGKLAAAFGSFGWSGEGVKMINANFANLKLKIFDEGLMIRFTPHQDSLGKCLDWGKSFGTKLLEKE